MELFNEMKKIFWKKGESQEMPETLEGAHSEDDIVDKFRECYESLYNSSGTEREMELLFAHIETMLQKDNDASNKIIESLNWRLVKEACKKMIL